MSTRVDFSYSPLTDPFSATNGLTEEQTKINVFLRVLSPNGIRICQAENFEVWVKL